MERERKNSQKQTTEMSEFIIRPGERGLISKYLSARHGADMLKRVITQRAEGLQELYAGFVRDEFSDTEGTRHLHPRASQHKHSGRANVHTESFQKVLASADKTERRRLKYSKTTEGNKLKSESIRIENPQKSDGSFIYLNLTSGMFEMREKSSMQNLIHGEPHVIPLTSERNHEKFSDILDVFTDEIVVLQQLTEVESTRS